MNWIDWVLLAAIALAAFKGWSRGFVVEVGSLVALVAGVWAGIHLSDQVVEWLGLGVRNAVVAFFITFLIVILAVHLLARFLTTVIDVAQLGLPNKAAGVLFGALRSV
ncbi:MAG: CvpA family protein, partial [Flavobacteriales bacterium]|nr:CvpA family protein [Flavobacteriales bacterium]